MWHLVCGDAAVEGVRFVLGETAARQFLQVMRDDLAVGPLRDVDAPPCARRAAFWQAVWPQAVQPVPDFVSGLSDDAAFLASLPGQSQAVTVWHGDSASEQLLLVRVAAALEHSELPLWEVSCGTGDSRVASRRAVAMHAPAALAKLYLPQPIEQARRQQLAAQWRGVLAEGVGIRRWRDNAFHGAYFSLVDDSLLAYCSAEWRPLARVMADVMAHCDGFFATDFFVFWRARELAAAGRLEITGEPGVHGYGGLQVRLAQNAG